MSYPVPGYLIPYLMTGEIAIISALLVGLNRALRRSPWPERDQAKAFWSVAVLLVGWYAVALSNARAGFYSPVSGPPTIQFGLLTPIIAGVLLFWAWPLLRRVLEIVPNQWIVGVQTYRVLGVIALVLYAGGHLPGLFALPAGVGDVLVGITAPAVAASYARGREGAGRRVRLWNLLGITDLVIAVTTGFLTSPSPLQMAAFDHPNKLIGMFPLVMIPVFAVPLSILLHIASLRKLRREQRSLARTSAGVEAIHAQSQ